MACYGPALIGKKQMRYRRVLAAHLVAAILFGISIGVPDAHAFAGPRTATKHVKLEGMGYLKARRIILSYGWKPVVGACEADKDTCQRYPEVDACSCCGTAPCGMAFVRRNQCL